jgi:TolB-like protein
LVDRLGKAFQSALVVVLLIRTCPFSFPQEKNDRPILTVLDFSGSQVSESELKLFADYMASHIVEAGQYRVIDRVQRDSILKEVEFSYSDCADEQCQLQVGKFLAAKYIIVGSLGKFAQRYLLNVKIVDVETGETIRAASGSYMSLEEIVDKSKELTVNLVGGGTVTLVPPSTSKEEKGQENHDTPIVVPSTKEVISEESKKFLAAKGPLPGGGRRGIALEGSMGLFMGWGLGAPTVSAGLTVQLVNALSFGAWVGYTSYSGGDDIGGFAIYWSPIIYGFKIIVGNKVDSVAFSLNVGWYPSIGFYFRNFFVNVSYLSPWLPSNSRSGGGGWLELGYSWYMGR